MLTDLSRPFAELECDCGIFQAVASTTVVTGDATAVHGSEVAPTGSNMADRRADGPVRLTALDLPRLSLMASDPIWASYATDPSEATHNFLGQIVK